MRSLGERGYADLLVSLGVLLSLATTLVAWHSSKMNAARALLALGCALGGWSVVSKGVQSGQGPFGNPCMGLAAIGLAVGLWSVSLAPFGRGSHILGGLAVSLTLGVYLFVPGSMLQDTPSAVLLFGLAEAAHVLATGALVYLVLGMAACRCQVAMTMVRAIVGIALLLQTTALILQGVGAQFAWGVYWSWDAIECWRLGSWLVTTIAALGISCLDWGRRRAMVAICLAMGVALLIVLGSFSLAQWLGLGSAYLVG